MAALLIVLGTMGIFSAETNAFRATINHSQATDQYTTTEATSYGHDLSGSLVRGLPY